MSINTVSTTPGFAGEKLLANFYNLREPIMIWGEPGIGKSDCVREFARNYKWKDKDGHEQVGMDLMDIRLTTLESVDLRGLPYINPETKETIWYKPEFFPTLDRPGIIFLDEITAAEPRLQASAYELVLDRRIGKYKLPDGWWVVAAGNRPEDGAVAYAMSTALADRFGHINMTAEPKDWLKWAERSEIDPNVMAFIRAKPDWLCGAAGQDKGDNLILPTPRSWHRVSNYMKQTRDRHALELMVPGRVGSAAAVQFFAVVEEVASLPSMEELMKMTPAAAAKKVPATIATLYGLTYSMVAFCSETKDYEKATEIFEAVSRINDKMPRAEIQTLGMELLMGKAANAKLLSAYVKTQAYKEYAKKSADITSAR